MDELFALLRRIPLFDGIDEARIAAEPLHGGLINRNFKVDCPKGTFVVRVAGTLSADIVSRREEAVNAKIASDAGVGPELLYYDETLGNMVIPFLPGETMNGEIFRTDDDRLLRAARTIRRLHDNGTPFAGCSEVFATIADYRSIMHDNSLPEFDGFDDAMHEAEPTREALANQNLPQRPCHIDTLAENFIDVDGRMYLIDYEFSGNTDPFWDLGEFAIETGIDDERLIRFLTAYLERQPTEAEFGRAVLYKALNDLFWPLPALIIAAGDDSVIDFYEYARTRLARCREAMASEAYARSLAAVRQD
jgi:thiamine kinase-like enzyme